ncbi:uncharacterized protein LOC124698959 [Lolium rigidum]|uniref:uncharacterized protein LOC124698959 n=1 Tax=Lolium rigidum TaxID=89674 RepID=UPI001F5DF888|nr:uncharacterized protein LOC124698959 [Lolium rigidum]
MASYTAQAEATESAVYDGSSCQQYQSTSQSCGLLYSPACQWKSMPSSVFPLGGCQNGVSVSNPMTALGTNGKELGLYSGHFSVQQQQNVSSDAKLELVDNVANPYQEFAMGMDGQFCSKRTNPYQNEVLATQGIWGPQRDMMINFSNPTGQSDMQLLMIQTPPGHLPAPSFFKYPNSSFIEAELSKVDQHHSDMQLPMTETCQVQLSATSLSKDPDTSLIEGTELKKVEKHDSDIQLPMTQTSHVQLPATSLSKDPNSSLLGRTKLTKVEQHDSDMQLPVTQTSHAHLPAPSLSKDPDSASLGGTGLKKVDQHDSDMQLPMTWTSHAQLPATSLSKDPNSPLIGQTELKKAEQHDSDMQLPMTQASHAQLPAPSLSKDPDSASLGGIELKKVDKHDSDMQLPLAHTSHVQLPAMSLSKGPNSSLIGRTELKKVGQHDLDMQVPMTQTSRAQLPPPSLSKDPDSASLGGTELKKVDQLDDYSQQSILLSATKPSNSSGSPINKLDGEVVSRPIKRKRSTAYVLTSHEQVMSRGGKMQCLSGPELDCANATERLPEKVDGENATFAENSTVVSRAQRRLDLTTSLIQYVLPVPPARLLAANVTNSSETVVYHISKLVVSDMYRTDNAMQSEYMPPNETSTSGKEDNNIVSEVLETFNTRFDELERSVSRAEKALTFQDFASEVRDIERWSILHRFVKLRMLQEYRRLHAGGSLDSTPHPFSTSILKHHEDPSMPLDSLNRVRCRLLK